MEVGTMASTITTQAMADLAEALRGIESAHGAITVAALTTETLYRKALGKDKDVPRTGDLAPKQWYKVAGLAEADYDKAKGYLSDARTVLTAAVANGIDVSGATTHDRAKVIGAKALALVAVAAKIEGALSLTKTAAAVRKAKSDKDAPKDGKAPTTRAKASASTKIDKIDASQPAGNGPVNLLAEAKRLGAAVAQSDVPLSDILLALFQGAGVNDRKNATMIMAAAWNGTA
jgi:hypothetical protein